MIPTNCTSTFDTGIKNLPIHLISEYKLKKFAAVKFKTDKATFLVYGSGKIVCVGASTPQVAETESVKLISHIRKVLAGEWEHVEKALKKLADPPNLTVSNVVATTGYNQAVALDRVYKKLQLVAFRSNKIQIFYEPERFVALTVVVRGATLLLFPSGKVNVTGVKDIKDAENAFDELNSLLFLPLRPFEYPGDINDFNYLCQSQNPIKNLEPKDYGSKKRTQTEEPQTTEENKRSKRSHSVEANSETPSKISKEADDHPVPNLINPPSESQTLLNDPVREENLLPLELLEDDMDALLMWPTIEIRPLIDDMPMQDQAPMKIPKVIYQDSLLSDPRMVDPAEFSHMINNQAENIKPAITNTSHEICENKHLSSWSVFLCKSCMGYKNVLEKQVFSQRGDGRFDVNITICKRCSEFNDQMYDMLCN